MNNMPDQHEGGVLIGDFVVHRDDGTVPISSERLGEVIFGASPWIKFLAERLAKKDESIDTRAREVMDWVYSMDTMYRSDNEY